MHGVKKLEVAEMNRVRRTYMEIKWHTKE